MPYPEYAVAFCSCAAWGLLIQPVCQADHFSIRVWGGIGAQHSLCMLGISGLLWLRLRP